MEKIALGPWYRGVPPELEPALEHVRGEFCETLEPYGNPTADLCAAKLYGSPFIPTDRSLSVLLEELKKNLPPSEVMAFDRRLEVGTPGAIISAYYGLLVALAGQAIDAVFDDCLEIATGFGPKLQASPLLWTQAQVLYLAKDTAEVFVPQWLVRACIDRNNYKFEDLYPIKWRAPRFISLASATDGEYLVRDKWNRPIEPWIKGTAKKTSEWVRSAEWRWTYRAETKLKHLVGELAVRLAKQGVPIYSLETQHTPNTGESVPANRMISVQIADDLRSVRIGREDYPLTKYQGAMMKVLIARTMKRDFVFRKALCAAIGSPSSDPRNSWKKSDLWRKGIVRGSGERYWLDLSRFEQTD